MRYISILASDQGARTLDSGYPTATGIPIRIEVPVDLDEISDPLAAFIAANITTTEPEEPGSLVRIVHPWTIGEVRLRDALDLNGEIFLGNAMAMTGAIERLRHRLTALERDIAAHGDDLFVPATSRYCWPVFGSVRGGWSHGVRTVEAYFDYCAREIRNQRGVVIAVGPNHERPDRSLWQEMARGRGFDPDQLVQQYDRHIARREANANVTLPSE